MKKKDYILQKKAYVSPGMKVIDVDTEQLMVISGTGDDEEGGSGWGTNQKSVFFDDFDSDYEDDGYGFDYSF